MDDMVRPTMDTGQALLILDVLLKALGTKVLALLALAMTFGLFCWAMRLQTWLGFTVATVCLTPTSFRYFLVCCHCSSSCRSLFARTFDVAWS